MSDDAAPPKSGDVIKEIQAKAGLEASSASKPEKDYIRRFQKLSIDAQVEYAHLHGIRDHYWHKGKWSRFLMSAVGGMLLFQSALLVAVGLGMLDFSQYEWLLPALMVQNLGQVIGLAVYAVKFLFSDITGKRDR